MKRWLILLLVTALWASTLITPAQEVRRRPIVAGGASTLLTGLAWGYKLEEASGTRADVLGISDLADNNTVTQTTGSVGNAAVFTSSSSEFLSHASSATLQMGNIDFTIISRAYINDTAVGTKMIVAKDNDAAGNREYVLYHRQSTNRFSGLVFKSGDSAVVLDASSFGALADDTWYCVAMWHNAAADTLNISVNNGTVDSIGTGGSLQAAGSAAFRLGAREIAGNESYMEGRIDEAYGWKRVLTSTEIGCACAAAATYPWTGQCQ